ncbi:MAG: hypothetical protein ACFFB3_07685 [Candidatus Hodarchaeota archaeon]
MANQEALDSGIGPITISIFAMTLIIILTLIFYITRYRKFTINQYVLHFRNGKLKKAGMGGRIFLLPVFDEIVTLPSIVQRNEFIIAKEEFRSSKFENSKGFIFIRGRIDRTHFGKSWILKHSSVYYLVKEDEIYKKEIKKELIKIARENLGESYQRDITDYLAKLNS